MTTADKLRAQRIRLGLTQRQVADRAGMNTVQYNGYERGRHEPSDKTMSRIAKVLKVSSDTLWGDEWSEDEADESIEDAKEALRQRVAKAYGWKLDKVRVTIHLD